jgi:transcriptional regulator with XRE-family HTH domain
MFTPSQEPQAGGSADAPDAGKAKAADQVAPPAPTTPAMKAGARLKAAREAQGLTLAQVGAELRIKRDWLAALESMNVNLIPGKAFARAYLRDYAKRLGFVPAVLLAQYESECARLREDADEQIRNPRSKPTQERPWFWALALALVCAGFVGWRALHDRGTEEVAATPKSPAVVAAPPTEAAPPLAAAEDPWAIRTIELRAVAPAWLEVRGSDGTIFLSRTLQAGERYRPDVGAGWTLHARDGSAFELIVDGQPAGLLGDPGAPVLGRQVDRIEPPAAPMQAAAAG